MNKSVAPGPGRDELVVDGSVRQTERRLQSVNVALHFITHDGVPNPPSSSILNRRCPGGISNNNTGISELIQVCLHSRATQSRAFRDFCSRRRTVLCQVSQDSDLRVVAAEHVNSCLYRGGRVRTHVSGHGIYLAALSQERSRSELSA